MSALNTEHIIHIDADHLALLQWLNFQNCIELSSIEMSYFNSHHVLHESTIESEACMCVNVSVHLCVSVYVPVPVCMMCLHDVVVTNALK